MQLEVVRVVALRAEMRQAFLDPSRGNIFGRVRNFTWAGSGRTLHLKFSRKNILYLLFLHVRGRGSALLLLLVTHKFLLVMQELNYKETYYR